jgi:hypothetical protein
MTLAVALVGVVLVYLAAFAIGWRTSARGGLDPERLFRAPRRLVDPVTARFQRWHDAEKMQAVREKRWGRLWLLISLNNLLAVALVSRTLYGVTIVLPAYFTWRQGFNQGALIARSLAPMNALMGVAVLEFGAYLVATALGVNIPLALLTGRPIAEPLTSLLVVYPAVAVSIVAGAWLEVRFLRDRMGAVSLPPDVDVEAVRAKAREILKRQWSDRQ